ncbi:MAG TPA: hypothetical protein VJR04_16035 [Terriglobales bacterium]|nr:hypothetical protein [Terriglobales bacterium]
MNNGLRLVRSNTQHARAVWTDVSKTRIDELRALTRKYGISVALGDIRLLDGHWHITHAGLLRLAQRKRCIEMRVQELPNFCDPVASRWVFKCTVRKSHRSRGFVGFGDADPSNVSPLVRGAEMRVAETRAVNRALRKAYGIGLCSVEELGSFAPRHEGRANGKLHRFPTVNGNGASNGAPRLRDRLCLLVRKYDLDAARVKQYAAEFCGTEVLRDASRDLVESFITSLEKQAATDRAALLCKLNSYPPQPEVHS